MFSWTVVNYHYVHDSCRNAFKGLKGHTVDQFRSQVRALAGNFAMMTAGEALDAIRSRTAASDICTITFDDGIGDIYSNVLPVLLEERVRATFFVNSEPLVDRRVLLVQKIHLLMGELGKDEFMMRFMRELPAVQNGRKERDPEKYGIKHSYRYDAPDIASFKELLNFRLPYELLFPLLDRIFVDVFGDESKVAGKLYASMGQISEMMAGGMEVGSHFHTHCIPAFLTDDQQRREVELSVRFLDALGVKRRLFSYPYGTENVWNQTTQRLLEANSVRAAFTMGRQIVRDADVPLLLIPRFSADDIFINKSNLLRKESYVAE